MVALTIASPLGAAGAEVLPPDVVWLDGTVGDFALSAAADKSAGGLQAIHPIETAVILCLYTDAEAAPEELTFGMGGDRRGWVGDGFRMVPGEPAAGLGSKLWLYRRHVLGPTTAAEIEAEAKRALQPLIDEGLVVRVDTVSEVLQPQGQISLAVDLYGRDGRKVYAAQFDPLWRTATPF